MAATSGLDKAPDRGGAGDSSLYPPARFRRLCGELAGWMAGFLLAASSTVFLLEITGIARASHLGPPPRGHDAPMAALGAVLIVIAVCSLGVISSLVLAVVAWICDRRWRWVCLASLLVTLMGAGFWAWLVLG